RRVDRDVEDERATRYDRPCGHDRDIRSAHERSVCDTTRLMTARTTLPDKKLDKALDRVQRAQSRYLSRYPGDSGARQAVHTVYGGAPLFTADTARKLGELAQRALDTYAPDAHSFAEAIGLRGDLAGKVYDRVRDKLRREAVEDFRIDFEDGYGNRSDD